MLHLCYLGLCFLKIPVVLALLLDDHTLVEGFNGGLGFGLGVTLELYCSVEFGLAPDFHLLHLELPGLLAI